MPRYQKIKMICDATCRIPDSKIPGIHYTRGKAACGYLIVDEQNNILAQGGKYLGELTVPRAEYEGLIFGLDMAVEFCRFYVEVWMDSELVVKQMNGDYCIRSAPVKELFDQVKVREQRFLGAVKYFHHSRGSFWGRHADKMANEEYSRNQTG